MSRDQLVLSLILGGVGGAWTRPDSRAEEAFSLSLARDVAAEAERAAIHALFVADGLTLDRHQIGDRPYAHLEPLTLFAALAAVTERIGFIATASTTYSEPYNLARQVASLDLISGGRAAWNVVTSSVGQENFGGGALPDHTWRYGRAAEFVEVATALWESWDDDAVVVDRVRRVYAERDRVHPVDHVGEHFQVAGPLNLPRSPQGRPVLVQAGSSQDGRELGTRYADVIFTAQQSLRGAQEFYADVRARAAALGRDPDELLVLPGASVVLGETEADARALKRELDGRIDLEAGLLRLERQLGGADLTGVALDEVPPEHLLPDPAGLNGRQSRAQVFRDLAVHEGWTVRRLIELEVSSNGHRVLVGTADQVADDLEAWFRQDAADGFVLLPSSVPHGVHDITRRLVPALQDRGVFRRDYDGPTLRENLGLPRPAGRRPRGAHRADDLATV